MYHYRIHNNSYATRTIGTNRVFSCLALRETEHHFLHKVNAYTEQNVIMVDLLFWQNIEQLFKNIIRADWDTDQKIKTISEVCANKDLQLLRKEAYNSKVRTILMGDIAWCYMNAGNSKYLKNVLMLLEPDIFDSISNETYEWMRENQILMSYIIMGEFDMNRASSVCLRPAAPKSNVRPFGFRVLVALPWRGQTPGGRSSG